MHKTAEIIIPHFISRFSLPIPTALTPDSLSLCYNFYSARKSRASPLIQSDSISHRALGAERAAASRPVIKLPYKRTSLLSISHSRAPPGSAQGSLPSFRYLLHSLSLPSSRGRSRSRSDIDARDARDLKTGIYPPSVKFNLSRGNHGVSHCGDGGSPLSYRRSYRLPHRPIIPQSARARRRLSIHLRHRARRARYLSPRILLSLYLSLRLRPLGTR